MHITYKLKIRILKISAIVGLVQGTNKFVQ